MKKISAISAVALAVLTAGAAATPSFARDYRGYGYGYDEACASKQHDKGTTGAVVGGVAGALLGSSLASRHGGRTGGAAIGAVAGALLGNSLGRSSAKTSNVCESRDYGRVAYRQTTPYYGEGYDRGYGERQYRSYGSRDRGHRYDPYSY
ncbi:glycine zipper 2TM domain-containing protein [Phenylobacterium sp. LjRoot225]|uniref:glycine zipper 2TM domain-containing protein n=1 Tax=Phenylobacterium sp. LjRoot225 TaxID=3342285 RepID=UPI003ECE3BB9